MASSCSSNAFTDDSSESDTMVNSNHFCTSPCVTVLVGPEKSKWSIHKTLVCNVSEFFDKAFNGPFKEREGTLELPEDDRDTFDIFVFWLYRRAVGTGLHGLSVYPSRPRTPDLLRAHLKAYTFADKYLITAMSRDILKWVHEFLTNFDETYYVSGDGDMSRMERQLVFPPDLESVRYLFDNTLPSSGMRRLLCDHFYVHLHMGTIPEKDEDGWKTLMESHPQFGVCLMGKLFDARVRSQGSGVWSVEEYF